MKFVIGIPWQNVSTKACFCINPGMGVLNNTFLSSTEFVTPTQAPLGPEMPYAITGHCIIKIDESTVMLTGGRYCEKSDGSSIILRLVT